MLDGACKKRFLHSKKSGVEISNCIGTERCTRQSVLIVAKNVQFHSNPTEADQYTAENVTQKEDHLEDIRLS